MLIYVKWRGRGAIQLPVADSSTSVCSWLLQTNPVLQNQGGAVSVWFGDRAYPLVEGADKVPKVCGMEQLYGVFFSNLIGMKIVHLTKKQLSSVPCPTCAIPVGHRCQLQAGGLRNEPHMARKVAAAEAIERKRISRPTVR
jgi:hypothetical protein